MANKVLPVINEINKSVPQLKNKISACKSCSASCWITSNDISQDKLTVVMCYCPRLSMITFQEDKSRLKEYIAIVGKICSIQEVAEVLEDELELK